MRTTVDLDTPILEELKTIARSERKSLGRLISELLAVALAGRERPRPRKALHWTARPMGARVDLDDKEALYAILDRR
ncbi:MAG: antitoxin [Acidobacteria bacterium]|nr:antitoxin [Acidobacteriota bacterium]